MSKRNAIWESYGTQDENGLDQLTCPDCSRNFYSLSEFRSHMQRKHGGISVESSEVEPLPQEGPDSVSPAGTRTERVDPSSTSASKPKTLSRKARELNDKLNEAINLVVKHFIDGLNELETERLSVLRGEVSTAVVGVEFDFEQRLFSVSGKVALAITVACLYILPKLPNFKQMAAKAKEKESESSS